MKRITVLVPVINIVGAVFTYVYFTYILEFRDVKTDIPGYYSPLFFVIGTVFLVFTFNLGSRKSVRELFAIAYGDTDIRTLEESEKYHLQREALQFPLAVSVISFAVWILAGFIFGLLEPLITGKLFNLETPDLIYGIRRFLGIGFLGGGVTTLLLYFILENEWRRCIPRFFPEGHLSRVRHVFRLTVRKRFLIVFLGVTLIPMPVLGVATYSRVMALHLADAVTRSRILASMAGELAFIAIDAFAISLILAYFLSKSISEPLAQIRTALEAVANDDLDTRVEIVSNDELGEVAEGFNRMIAGMREHQKLKDSFGKFVSREIRDEIMAGKSSLDGEMKRTTLLFSDPVSYTHLTLPTN